MYYICGVKQAKLTYQELRLGNIVHYKNRIKLHTLCVTSLDEIKVKLGGCLLRYDQVIPVPLTEKVLTDWCGFVYDDFEDAFNKNGVKLHYNSERSSVEIRLCGRELKITGLHQLQNLYYAITGEELKIAADKIDLEIDTWGPLRQRGEHSKEYLDFCKKYDEQQRGADGYDLNSETDSARGM